MTDDNLLMIADSMVTLKHLAVSGVFAVDELLSVLTPPNLPRLEQLAYFLGPPGMSEHRAAAATELQQVRPELSVVVVPGRAALPRGFVGAYPYY
jgi:hypothetical protein